jgi:hypothetical protein
VFCPDGLSPSDELYLWGLLALNFSQPEPSLDFSATPHYCLRQLGCIDRNSDHGGKQFALFRQAIYRLASVVYKNDGFYDPIRGEHRDVAFGFFGYSLPIDPASSRAWRFSWHPLFFEFCRATGGALGFDLHTYRQLDNATRRLYLLLKKVFWRKQTSPQFDLRHLAVDVLGFSPLSPAWKLRQKTVRCIEALLDLQILCLPPEVSNANQLFRKRGPSTYAVCLHRGSSFDNTSTRSSTRDLADSPHYDVLRRIGLDDQAIRWVLRQYRHKQRVVAECADMTIAKIEQAGDKSFSRSPQAYFIDNLREIASRRRTWPDWWREKRKQEQLLRREAQFEHAGEQCDSDQAFEEYLRCEAKEAFENLMQTMFRQFTSTGQTEREARRNADDIARRHLRYRFRHSAGRHPRECVTPPDKDTTP